MRLPAVLLMLALLPTVARAEDRLAVVVRAGPQDATIVTRLKGQLAGLDGVTLTVEATGDAIEPTLEAQLAAADRIGAAKDARVVVWFIPRGKTLAVAISTPRDHRLFVREVPQSSDSATAEAAAITVRSAVRSISLGGTIGVEVPATTPPAPDPVPDPAPAPVRPPRGRWTLSAALGWQTALDGGADRGGHALVQRTTLARGAWGASLTLALGVPLAWQAGELALEVSRSGAIVGGERRLGGGVAIGAGIGALVYHRSTSMAPSGLTPTASTSTVAAAGAVELTWRARLAAGVRLLACAGVDLVAGAPVAAVDRGGTVEDLDRVRSVQVRAALAVEVVAW